MFFTYVFFIVLSVINITHCNWMSEWMVPVQEQLKKTAAQKLMEEEVGAMLKLNSDGMLKVNPVSSAEKNEYPYSPQDPGNPGNSFDMSVKVTDSGNSLKTKLERTLSSAEELIGKLQDSILALENKERKLKEAIVNGSLGVTTVTVSVIDKTPRQYLVREGLWSFCQGMLQHPSVPATHSLLYEVFAEPRCIGTEVISMPDPCVFNSIIKYEVIPERRRLEYTEEDVFCLKPMFNKSMEQYHSVPRKTVDATCQGGSVRKLDDQMRQCGKRVMAEYSYYPKKALAATQFPLEYCTEKDGSCKLIVAWHISNTTVENFEFLKNDVNFKKYFIQSSGSASPTAHSMLIE